MAETQTAGTFEASRTWQMFSRYPGGHKRSALCLCLLLLAGACAAPARRVVEGEAAAGPKRAVTPNRALAPSADAPIRVSPDRYLSHIALLAHDELEGREAGQRGIDLAAGYIAGQFAAAGLAAGGPGGTYFQPFTFGSGKKLLDDTRLVVDGSVAIETTLHEDFRPFGFSAPGEFAGDLTFVGYGITNPDEDHDDYAGVDATGKVVLMLRREPAAWDEEGFTKYARFKTKVQQAAENGAVAVLVVNQDPGEDGIDRLMRFGGGDDVYDIPAVHVTRALAEKLLQAGGPASLTALQQRLDEHCETVSSALDGVHVSGTVSFEVEERIARNVIGVLPGAGPHADEYVVIGGHYDHVGVRRGDVHNGADDNASGTAGVIELAWALAATPQRDRSVLFMAFSGEEKGLLGSKHFCADPTVPVDSIVAMLNLDMIGRLTPGDEANMLAVHGLGTGASFGQIVARHARTADIEYLSEDSALSPSDHVSFYRAGIPSLFFFTGIHEDLHQPGDDTEKINAAGGARIVALVYDVAADVINATDAPVFARVDRRASIFRSAGPRGGGVVMGIIPDMEDDSDREGWPVVAVLSGRGAAAAGMKAGDRIIQIDGQTVSGIADYRAATANKEPGDVLEVTVLRGDKKLILNVELSAR